MSAAPPESRPGALTDRDVEMLSRLEKLANIMAAIRSPGGANIQASDPRMTQLQTWFIGVCAVGILGLLAWSINGLVQQGLVLREVATQVQSLTRRIERLEDRK